MKLNKGFTLIELLIVIAILGILAAAIIVAINPGKRLTQSKIAGAFRFAKQIDYSLQFEGVGQWDFDTTSNPSQALDSSVNNNNHGTITGAIYNCNDTPYHILGSGYGKCALSFDGVDDSIVVSNFTLKIPYTVSAWVKINDLSNDANDRQTITRINSGPNYAFLRNVGYGNKRFTFTTNFGGTLRVITGSTQYNFGTWYHVLGVHDTTGTLQLYVNGEKDNTPVGGAAITGSMTNNLYIGKMSTEAFNGLIDDVHIYNNALTKTEIQQMYAQTAPMHQIASSQ